MKDQKVSFNYFLAVLAVVLITWFIHEFAHWVAYRSFGFEAFMSFNKAGVRGNALPSITQQMIGTAAGPIITLLQAIIAYMILNKKGWNKYIYPLLFTAFYMRFLAGIMNVISPNDEGVISQHFGLGLFTISILISAILFWMVFKTSKKYQLTAKFHLFTTLLVMFFSSLLILTDQFFRLELL
jgi:hypothetical protein